MFKDWLDGKREEKKADYKARAEDAQLRKEYTDKFSRRFVLLVFAMPIIVAMFDAEYGTQMFEGLKVVPTEWMYTFLGIVTTIYGHKTIMDWKRAK